MDLPKGTQLRFYGATPPAGWKLVGTVPKVSDPGKTIPIIIIEKE